MTRGPGTGTAPAVGVVIPAHDEETVIGRCLTALFDGVDPAHLEVVVVCNGCTDATADAARATGLPVRVIELVEASKIAALRAGDLALGNRSWSRPRLYLDADVVLSGLSALDVAEALGRDGTLAARPPLRYDVTGASPLVRRYFAARSRVPELLDALWGAGVYGLSAEGHARVTPWPDVLADDLHVDRTFARHEISVVPTRAVVVRVPRTTAALLRVLTRAQRGTAGPHRPAVDRNGPAGDRNGSTLARTAVGLARAAVRNPRGLGDTAVFAGFAVAARIRSRRRPAGRGASPEWERDVTSRTAIGSPSSPGR